MQQDPSITTLEQVSLAAITDAFNAAFSDYKIRLQLTPDEMATKIRGEGIRLECSAGAFSEGRLVSFILHGVDTINGRQVVYNAGTGTLPQYRGHGLAQRLYRFIIPRLKQQGLHHHQLEVFDDNARAIKVYANMGFTITRRLQCYRGKVAPPQASRLLIGEVPLQETLFGTCCSYSPSWQNDFPAIRRNLEAHKVIGASRKGTLLGYAIYVAATGRLRQLAVHPACRRQGVGSALLGYIGNDCGGKDLLLTNVQQDDATQAFFAHLGFEHFLDLYEMHLDATAWR